MNERDELVFVIKMLITVALIAMTIFACVKVAGLPL